MAINATINKISLNIADMDRHYYQTHELTIAQHPSETDFRFMIRVIAFAANASAELCFSKGLASDEEPELWQKTLTGDIELWIDFFIPKNQNRCKTIPINFCISVTLCCRKNDAFIFPYYYSFLWSYS